MTLLAATGPVLAESDLPGRMAHGLKISETAARDALAGLAGSGLIAWTGEAAPQVTLTAAGSARYGEIRDGIARITERLYGGLAAADLAVAHRVLTAVTERANAVLAAG